MDGCQRTKRCSVDEVMGIRTKHKPCVEIQKTSCEFGILPWTRQQLAWGIRSPHMIAWWLRPRWLCTGRDQRWSQGELWRMRFTKHSCLKKRVITGLSRPAASAPQAFLHYKLMMNPNLACLSLSQLPWTEWPYSSKHAVNWALSLWWQQVVKSLT